jgi:hypothetical protein
MNGIEYVNAAQRVVGDTSVCRGWKVAEDTATSGLLPRRGWDCPNSRESPRGETQLGGPSLLVQGC